MNNKKKILIFSTAYCPFVGGAEVAVKEITDRLGEDFEFDMITARLDNSLPRYEKIGNVDVHRVGFSFGSRQFIQQTSGDTNDCVVRVSTGGKSVWS